MRIGIQTWGSEGDLNPFIALASGLSKAGHTVTLAITTSERRDFTSISEKFGFTPGVVDYIGSSEEHLNLLGKKMIDIVNPLSQLKFLFREMFEPGVHNMYKTAQSLVADNDILIGHFIHYPLQTACEKANKPYITVSLNHGAIPTAYFPPFLFPNCGKFFNPLLWRLTSSMINHAVLPFINKLRTTESMHPVRSFRAVWESPLCNLIAISPVLCPPAPDWNENNKVCGFFNMDDFGQKWEMPENLEDFLRQGDPPVYVTLGSMTGTEHNSLMMNETTKLLYDAIKIAGCRAIIQSRWMHVTTIPEDENIFRVNAAPHTRVFPKCKLVIHHGGAGTTQTATLCGRPSIIIAHILDQFLFGHLLKQLGIGGNVFSRHAVTPRKLAKEIHRVMRNKQMEEKAKDIGSLLSSENGVFNAVKNIESIIATTA